MLNEVQIQRMLKKLRGFEDMLEPMLFEKIGEPQVEAWVADKQYHDIPADKPFAPIASGWQWGADGQYCWLKGSFTVPEELDGRDLFIKPHVGFYEAMLWVNGKVSGTFATKIVYTSHGNHYCDLLKKNAKAGETIEFALELYAGHTYKGCHIFEKEGRENFDYIFDCIDICTKNAEINEFYFDLKTVNEVVKILDENSFRRGEGVNALYDVHNLVYYSPEDCTKEEFMAGIRAAQPALKAFLSKVNASDAPYAGLIGHSHMDTAWLWHIDETIKKCARTYSNQLSLMEQYPEYMFVQSSACHSDMMRKYYPELFARIQQKVKEGKYEPNGGVWVECDCNITSGEAMVRQFLWGQRFTRKYFDYTSNCFWLPDTFGYSAAIPQIMKGCGVDYFLTTKLSWNDTNAFPYDTFYWQGIDGTKVFTHFNQTHVWPAPEEMHGVIVENKNSSNVLKQKSVTNKRLISYGYGDGGGGPQFEMCEMARRCKDLNGVPKSEYTLVGDFMKDLEATAQNPNTYRGELYLELHRGTLTNQHQIKRNNRKVELSLRNLEYLTVANAVKNGEVASTEASNPLYETLLINQFHDILPGTCIPRAHEQSRREMGEVLSKSAALIEKLTAGEGGLSVTLTNTLSFERSDVAAIDYIDGYVVDGGYAQQLYTDLDGNKKLLVAGVKIPAFSSVTLKLVKGEIEDGCAFVKNGNVLETPFAAVTFNSNMTVSSFVDKSVGRELCGEGYAFNTLIMAEDLPALWDNWDVDADIEGKYKDVSVLISSELVSCGKVAYILRNKYQISTKSTVEQDMMFFADSAEVRFDTKMDWNDDHRFLKATFDTSVFEDFARQEVQFGYVKRPTTRNTSIEQAKFEVLNHKYTDLSEARYGVAILNDCKYGISLNGGQLRLSLHKGGVRPDFTGDHGVHRCVYSFLPHNCGFSADSVIKPAYQLNVPSVVSKGEFQAESLACFDAANIIIESVKPCEDCEKAFILRAYEAEGAYTNAKLSLFDGAKKAEETNMLEEVKAELSSLDLTFRPFEIKTLKITY